LWAATYRVAQGLSKAATPGVRGFIGYLPRNPQNSRMNGLIQSLQNALALDHAGEVDAAVTLLDTMAGDVPDDGSYQKMVGLLYQRLGADRQSIDFLTRAAAHLPEDPEVHLGLGYHYMDNAAPEAAVAAFTEYLVLRPEDAHGLSFRGRCHEITGALQEAEADLREACRLAPIDPEPRLHLGCVLLRLGQHDDALDMFREARQLEPENILAEIGLRRATAMRGQGVPPQRGTGARPATVVCVKQGTKYGPEYVNRLASMVRRHTTLDPRFVCFTEDTEGLTPDIETAPLPEEGLQGWWNKVALFKSDLNSVEGRLLYLDLDVIVTGSLDPLLRYESSFTIMDNDYVPGFNTSVVLFEAGSYPKIWEDFTPDIAAKTGGDQDWVSLCVPEADLWPDGWCVPYRLRAVQGPPEDAKVVAFCGRPNPSEYPAPWIADLWK